MYVILSDAMHSGMHAWCKMHLQVGRSVNVDMSYQLKIYQTFLWVRKE